MAWAVRSRPGGICRIWRQLPNGGLHTQTVKTVVFWIVIVGSGFLLWQVLRAGSSAPAEPEISYSRFLEQIANGQVSKVIVMGSQIRGYDTKGSTFRVVIRPIKRRCWMHLNTTEWKSGFLL
jgi:ATP-dependent Zn protease